MSPHPNLYLARFLLNDNSACFARRGQGFEPLVSTRPMTTRVPALFRSPEDVSNVGAHLGVSFSSPSRRWTNASINCKRRSRTSRKGASRCYWGPAMRLGSGRDQRKR